jgi:hypothetical protein
MYNKCDRHPSIVNDKFKKLIIYYFCFVRKTILRKIRLPSNFCVFRENPNCNGLTNYRTITGVCNNLRRPYQGSSQTAFGRLLPAVYDDGRCLSFINLSFFKDLFIYFKD